MATPDTLPVRIKIAQAVEAKKIARELKTRRSIVLESAIAHGMPIARQLLAKKG